MASDPKRPAGTNSVVCSSVDQFFRKKAGNQSGLRSPRSMLCANLIAHHSGLLCPCSLSHSDMPERAQSPTGSREPRLAPPLFAPTPLLLEPRTVRTARRRACPRFAPRAAATAPRRAADVGAGADLSAACSSVRETQPAVRLTVQGALPAWLHGTLTRVGPAVFEARAADGSEFRFSHWFDGLPFVWRFEIDGAAGTVDFDSRHVGRHVERAVASVATATKYEPLTVGTRLKRPWWRKIQTLFGTPTRDEGTPNSECIPVGVVIERGSIMGEPFVLTTDAPMVLCLDPESLDPQKFVKYSDLGTAGGQLSCAHGQWDAAEGAYYNLLMSLVSSRGTVEIIRIDANTGKSSVFARIANVPGSTIHDFAMTENYFVVVIHSARVKGLSVLKERCLLDGVVYDDDASTLLYVVCRKTGRHVSTYSAPSSFFFHIPNAYEPAPGCVTVDVCSYENMDVYRMLTIEKISSGAKFPRSFLTSYTLRGLDTEVSDIRYADIHRYTDLPTLDLPSINPELQGRKHRFVYGVTVSEKSQLFGGIAKIDLAEGESHVYRRPGCYASEPIFVAAPHGEVGDGLGEGGSEDDGCVLFVELDVSGSSASSALVVLDATTMTELARCETPAVVPFHFHGNFLSK